MKKQFLIMWAVYFSLLLVGCDREGNGIIEDSETKEVNDESVKGGKKGKEDETEKDLSILLADGRRWCVGTVSFWPVSGEIVAYSIISIDGKYECDGKKYKKLKLESTPIASEYSLQEVRYLSPIREEEGKIYVLDTLSRKEHLDFDCNMKVGDKDPCGYVLTEITFKSVGQYEECKRKCFIFELGDYGTYKEYREYIEGVGYTEGAFLHDPLTTGGGFKLICCHEADGTCIYGEKDHVCLFTRIAGLRGLFALQSEVSSSTANVLIPDGKPLI